MEISSAEKEDADLNPGFTLVILVSMKTAVSVPDSVFEAGERLAQRLGLSRSGLYAEALREYVERHEDEDEITRRLNEVYAENPAEIDPSVSRIAARALPRESWK